MLALSRLSTWHHREPWYWYRRNMPIQLNKIAPFPRPWMSLTAAMTRAILNWRKNLRQIKRHPEVDRFLWQKVLNTRWRCTHYQVLWTAVFSNPSTEDSDEYQWNCGKMMRKLVSSLPIWFDTKVYLLFASLYSRKSWKKGVCYESMRP